MSVPVVTFIYRQVCEPGTQDPFARQVLDLTYQEFLLKSQAYNPGASLKTFTELKQRDGRANSLHYKCGFAASGLIEQLHNKIPVLQDTLGRPPGFDTWQFELIESHISEKGLHKAAVLYTSKPFSLLAFSGSFLVLGSREAALQPYETFVLELQPGLSVNSWLPV